MAAVIRLVRIGLPAVFVLLLVQGCQTPDEPSALPWNTPTDWEKRGIVGTAMPQ